MTYNWPSMHRTWHSSNVQLQHQCTSSTQRPQCTASLFNINVLHQRKGLPATKLHGGLVTAQHGWMVDRWDAGLVTENQPNTLIHQLQHRKNRSNQKSISQSKGRKISKWSPREGNVITVSFHPFHLFPFWQLPDTPQCAWSPAFFNFKSLFTALLSNLTDTAQTWGLATPYKVHFQSWSACLW